MTVEVILFCMSLLILFVVTFVLIKKCSKNEGYYTRISSNNMAPLGFIQKFSTDSDYCFGPVGPHHACPANMTRVQDLNGRHKCCY